MKNLLLFLPVFIWLQACSQSPAPNAAEQQAHPILFDTTGASLGDSPNREFRLFKFSRKTGDQSEIVLKLLRLKDLQETLVSTLLVDASSSEPKIFWSQDSKYLVLNHSVPDSTFKSEVVLFSLPNFSVAQRNPGALIAFDAMNEVVFFYRSTAERQSICYYDLKNPVKETVRDIIVPPVGKLPTVIFSYKERRAKVKAYTTDDTPMNVALEY